MTVSAGARKISYTGTGADTVLSVTFKYFEANDLAVIKRVTATGVETVLTSGVHYSASTPSDPPGTGTVTPITGATNFPSSCTWTIVRTTDRSQSTDYVENDAFPAETHEKALDRLTMIAQEVDEDAGRSLRFPASDSSLLDPTLPSSVDRASTFLAFDADGNPITSTGVIPDDVIVSAYGETLVDDLSAEDARVTLDAQEDVITTRGDIVRGSALGAAERLAKGADGQYLKAGASDVAWDTLTTDDISRASTSPIPATILENALQLLAMAYSRTNMSGAQDNVASGSAVAVTGLGNVSIPGTGNSSKVYVASGQVTVKTGTVPASAQIKVHLGTNGTVADAVIAAGNVTLTPPVPYTLQIPQPSFVPGATDKLTVSITIGTANDNDLDSDAIDTFLVIRQIANA